MLHLPTLLILTAAVYVIAGVTMTIVFRAAPEIPGLSRFPLAYALTFVGALSVAVGSKAPLVSYFLGNTLLVIAGAVLLDGQGLFLGRPVHRVAVLALAVFTGFGFLVFTVVMPHPTARLVLFSVSSGALFGTGTVITLRSLRTEGAPAVLMAVCLGSVALAMVTRLVFLLLPAPPRSDLSAAVLLVVPLAGIGGAFGVIASVSRRSVAELRARSELLHGLVDLGHAPTDGPRLPSALTGVLALVRGITDAKEAELRVFDSDRSLVHAARVGDGGRPSTVVADPDLKRAKAEPAPDDQGEDVGAPRRELSLSLRTGAERIGVLTVTAREPTGFPPEHLRLLRFAAGPISLALQSALSGDATAHLVKSLAAQTARLSAVIQMSRDGLLVVSEGHVSLVNKPALALLGAEGEPGTWTGETIARLLSPMAGREAKNAYALQLALGGGEAGPELGGELHLREAAVVWRTIGVPGVGQLLVLREVTRERQLERMRENLTNTMVHDLRGPITSILGALNLVREPGLDEPSKKEMLEIAIRNTESQLTLVNAILDVSRMEEGAMPLHPAELPVRQAVADVLSLVEPRARPRGIALVNKVPENLSLVWADRELVGRILENLVGNAIKFSPPHERVTISAEETRDKTILVRVADRGSAVPDNLKPRLFQKFAAGGGQRHGSGLGLLFCRLAVEAQGGSIWLEEPSSAPGGSADSESPKGSSFAFTLPIARLRKTSG